MGDLLNKRVLILGGSGFIGRNLVGYLSDKVESLSVLSRSECFVDKCTRYIGSVENTSLLAQALSGIDLVYHLVGSASPSLAIDSPYDDANSNIMLTIKILDACVKANVSRVVYIASGGTLYGTESFRDEGYSEDDCANPSSEYGISKYAAEMYLRMYEKRYGISCFSLRVSNLFGPYQQQNNKQGVVGTFINNILDDKPLTVWGDGEAVRDYLYIEELVRVLSLIQEYKGRERIFNVGSGVGLSVNDLITSLSSYFNKNINVQYIHEKNLKVSRCILKCQRIYKELGWENTTKFNDALGKTIEWYKGNPPNRFGPR